MRCLTLMSLLALATAGHLKLDREKRGQVKRTAEEVRDLLNAADSLAGSADTLYFTLQTYERRLKAMEAKVEANLKGVAFSARISGKYDSQDYGLHLTRRITVKFDDTVYNGGNAYNNGTGIFTAPIAGIYAFYLNEMSPNNVGQLYLSIVKGGDLLDIVYAEGRNDHYDQGYTHITTHMNKDEQVWVRQSSGEGVRGSWYTVFSGYLIAAD